MTTIRCVLVVCLACVISSARVAYAQGPFVETNPVVIEWVGELEGEMPELKERRAVVATIVDQEGLSALWRERFPGGIEPRVNFETHLVVSTLVKGLRITGLRVGDHGAIGKHVYARHTFAEEPYAGVSWGVAVIPIGNIEMFQGSEFKRKPAAVKEEE